MFARRPAFPWSGSGAKRGIPSHVAWILAAVYLCGVLTVPLITISSSIVTPLTTGGGQSDTNADPEAIVLSNTQLEETSAESSSNPTVRRRKVQRQLQVSRHLALDTKHPTDFYIFNRSCADPVADPWSYLIDNLFDGASPYDDFPPHWASTYLHPGKAKGWGSKGKVFERLLEEVRPKVVIELGAFLGASTIHLANVSRNLGLQTTIFAVDDFRGWGGFRKQFPNFKIGQVNANVLLLYQFMRNVAAQGFQDAILPIPYSTSAALTAFCKWGIHADLIEVDAGHDFHSAWIDINAAFSLLKAGGVMFGHDYQTKYDRRGVRRAVDLFARTYGFTVEPDDQHWIIRGTP